MGTNSLCAHLHNKYLIYKEVGHLSGEVGHSRGEVGPLFLGSHKFTFASTAVGKGEIPSEETWWPGRLNSAIPN